MAHYKLLRVNAWNYRRFPSKLRKELKATVQKFSVRIAKDIRADMKKPKHGRPYHYKGKIIIASAPGESPAIRSHTLHDNVVPIYSNDGLQARIDPLQLGVPYARRLELGDSIIAKRPYIKPAFARRRAAFLKEVRSKLAKSIKAR